MKPNAIARLSLLEALAQIVDDPDFLDDMKDEYDDEGVKRGPDYVNSIFQDLDKLNESSAQYYECESDLPDELREKCRALAWEVTGQSYRVWDGIEWWLSQSPSHEQGEALLLLGGDLSTLVQARRSLLSLAEGFGYRHQVQKEKKRSEERRAASDVA